MFRKFIRFGDAIRPYWKRTVGVFPSDNLPTATINPVLFKIRKFCTSVTVPGQNDNLLKSTCLSNLCTWIVLWLCWCHSAMQVSQCAIKFARAGNTAGYIICCCQRICPQGFDCSSLSDLSCVVTETANHLKFAETSKMSIESKLISRVTRAAIAGIGKLYTLYVCIFIHSGWFLLFNCPLPPPPPL